jgi:hypothetical protein
MPTGSTGKKTGGNFPPVFFTGTIKGIKRSYLINFRTFFKLALSRYK